MRIRRGKQHVTHAKRSRWYCVTCNGWLHERITVQNHRKHNHEVVKGSELPIYV
jgi:hypothetical protein